MLDVVKILLLQVWGTSGWIDRCWLNTDIMSKVRIILLQCALYFELINIVSYVARSISIEFSLCECIQVCCIAS